MESEYINLRFIVPQKLHREYKSKCSLVGVTMQDQTVGLLAKWCAEPIEQLVAEQIEAPVAPAIESEDVRNQIDDVAN